MTTPVSSDVAARLVSGVKKFHAQVYKLAHDYLHTVGQLVENGDKQKTEALKTKIKEQQNPTLK